MGRIGPRRGSISFWHRRRAEKIVPRMRSWNYDKKAGALLGTIGFKAGMTHVVMVDDSESPMKGQEVARAVTIVEVPPIFIYSIVAYSKTVLGLKAANEAIAQNLPKDLVKYAHHTIAKKGNENLANIEKQVAEKTVHEIRIIAASQGYKIKTGKKVPDFFELAISGTAEEQLTAAKAILGKEVPISQIFEEGEFVDIIAVTKGKGWQGVVKRFGVALNPMKATQARRHGGSLGAETPARVFFTIPRPGQMGFHRRTDANKRILKISSNPEDATPKNGFLNYGKLNSDYIVLDGSIPGPAKRPIRLRKSMKNIKSRKPEIKFIDKNAKN